MRSVKSTARSRITKKNKTRNEDVSQTVSNYISDFVIAICSTRLENITMTAVYLIRAT